MAFKFPFTNYHELNLTWILEQLKKLFEESNENVETIEGYEDRLSAVETELPVVEATANQAETVANAAATLAQTAKSTADTANENALTASAQAGLARQEAATAEAEAQAATQAAQQAQATAQDFDGRITQAEENASEALQEAQSFENRVDAAINTANNAANTATIAQGIAVNANQNAATALDTAQTADGKAEAAQDAADIADNKAEAAQDAADIADGKAEAAQDTADQNAANIGNLADLTTTAKNNLVAAINEAAQSGGGGGGGAVTSVNGKTGDVVLDAEDIAYNSGTVASELESVSDKTEFLFNASLGNDYFKVASVNKTATNNSNNQGSITAPDIDGYTFFCWIGASSVGFDSYANPEIARSKTTTLWGQKLSGISSHYWKCTALYVRNDVFDDLYITVETRAASNNRNEQVEAPTREGYNFLFWIAAATAGYVSNCYYQNREAPITRIYDYNTYNSSTGRRCTAVYTKKTPLSNYIKTHIQNKNISNNIVNGGVEFSAVDIPGYKFLCWLQPSTTNYYGYAFTLDQTAPTTTVRDSRFSATDNIATVNVCGLYIADDVSYSDSRVTTLAEGIAPIENGETAKQAYVQGAYFWHNNKFCKASTAIASGSTFTLNTNYIETTVAAELLAAQN